MIAPKNANRADQRQGFTLVEILIVISILAILAGLTAGAVASVGQTARESRTKAIVAICNDAVLTRWESLKDRPLAIPVPDFAARLRDPATGRPTSGGVDGTVELTPREAARVRLMMLRDLMRMELPDRITDVTLDATPVRGAAYFESINASGVIVRTPPFEVDVTWNNSGLLESYRDRVPFTTGATPTILWTQEYESSECLYLILSTTFTGGVSAISSIPASNIGDLDEDGMPEILDGWENPIGFIRWPVGYVDTSTIPPVTDELDLFQVDWGYVSNNAPDALPYPSTTHNVKHPFSLRPLIVSAGADGVFDLRFRPGVRSQGSNPPAFVSYRDMTWPTNQMGNEQFNRQTPYYFIDPYLRQYRADGLVGEYFDTENDGDEQRVDNITNFDLQGTTG